VDATGAVVKYDGYLVSTAAAIAPSVGWRSARTALAARGTFLLFQSGHTSIQGLVTASTFSQPAGPLRFEALAEVGASTYERYASFAHLLGGVRLHLLGRRWGVWAGPMAGDVSRGGGGEGAAGYAAGWWARGSAGAVQITWTRITVIDTAFGDLRGHVEWRTGPLELTGSAGWRSTSRGGTSGGYGEASAAWRIARWGSLIVAAGRYPSDPVTGSIGGRYVTGGLRLAPQTARADAARAHVAALMRRHGEEPPVPVGATVALQPDGARSVLLVRAPGAHRVEVMGDFTAWLPVTLVAADTGTFRYPEALAPGLYRFNLRVDGRPWGVPQGAAVAVDEFGGTVGLLAVR
jgi:hypothetical protein